MVARITVRDHPRRRLKVYCPPAPVAAVIRARADWRTSSCLAIQQAVERTVAPAEWRRADALRERRTVLLKGG